MARALTKPTITERGTNRISRATPSTPSTTWMIAGEDDRGDQVVQAVLAHQRGDHEGDGAGGGRDHRGAPAEEGDGRRHRERGEQADSGVDAGDDRERDGLGDQRQGHDEAAEDLDAQAAR